jgi:hypothetical protein
LHRCALHVLLAQFCCASVKLTPPPLPCAVSPVPPSLSLLCAPLCSVISSVLLQHITAEAGDPDSNSDCLLAQHSHLVSSGSAFAVGQTPTVLSALNFLRDFDVSESTRNSFTRPHLSSVVSSMFAQFVAQCEKHTGCIDRDAASGCIDRDTLSLFSRSLDMCTQCFLGKSSTVIDSTVKTDSAAFLFKNEEIETSSNFIENITASSSSGMTRSLLSSDWDTFWQSDGVQGSHWICVQLKDGIFAKDVGICVQTDDQSWCPKVITVRAAQSMDLLRAMPKVELNYSARVSRGGQHFLKALDDNAGTFPRHLILHCCLSESNAGFSVF